MRRQRKRVARQAKPRISKVTGSYPELSSITEEEKPETQKTAKIDDDDDPVRAELVSRLNDAVTRWKEEKNIPGEKKKGAISKVLKKLSKKGKKDKKSYEEAKNFLKKISNFNPTDVENLNLDDIKQKKEHERLHHHPRSIEGVKLEINVRDKPKEKLIRQEIDLNKHIKTKHIERKRKQDKKEIEDAIKSHHKPRREVYDKKSLHIEVSEEEIPEIEQKIPQKRKQEKIEKKDLKIDLDKFKKSLGKTTVDLTKGIKGTLGSLKTQVKKGTEKSMDFLKEKQKKYKHNKNRRIKAKKEEQERKKRQIAEKNKLDKDIEKIYKEIEQI